MIMSLGALDRRAARRAAKRRKMHARYKTRLAPSSRRGHPARVAKGSRSRLKVVSGRDVPRLRATLRERPAGLHERRAFSPKDRETVWNAAQEALRAEAISPKAAAYLQEWAIGTRRRKPRPETYEFLTPVTAAPAAAPRQGPPMWRAGREVLIRPAAGAPALPLEGDCHAEDDGLAIVLEEG